MITLGNLLMHVEYDKTVVLVEHGTDEQILIFTQSEELEYNENGKKLTPHLGRDVMNISTTPTGSLYIEIL